MGVAHPLNISEGDTEQRTTNTPIGGCSFVRKVRLCSNSVRTCGRRLTLSCMARQVLGHVMLL
jgi:hypothetical protein